ncbi:uncharacterized protein LOC114721099 [Neltuma alba]|uniref:uncharacterized protein LOC114721099 n=1 Tax=Neltuma alba TaxID=207710 RepID=UPI0010A49C40|nr:uncharacterized protein LOC114721099 [Prosopis alba]
MAWKSHSIRILVLEENHQYFHVDCQIPGRNSFILTALYAKPHHDYRQQLWRNLFNLSQSISNAWVVFGDFNDILAASDRIGGAQIPYNRIDWFQSRIRDCGLVDMGFKGPKFTWRGPRLNGLRRLYERLDRALCNSEFLSSLSDCYLKVLPRTNFSDHNPICLQFHSSHSGDVVKPFRFEAMWLEHDDFNRFLSS